MDDLLQKKPELRPFIREIHPEICFHAMAGGFPMQHKKRSEAGYAGRLTLIKAHVSDAEALIKKQNERILSLISIIEGVLSDSQKQEIITKVRRPRNT